MPWETGRPGSAHRCDDFPQNQDLQPEDVGRHWHCGECGKGWELQRHAPQSLSEYRGRNCRIRLPTTRSTSSSTSSRGPAVPPR
jgi:hypothetical protein